MHDIVSRLVSYGGAELGTKRGGTDAKGDEGERQGELARLRPPPLLSCAMARTKEEDRPRLEMIKVGRARGTREASDAALIPVRNYGFQDTKFLPLPVPLPSSHPGGGATALRSSGANDRPFKTRMSRLWRLRRSLLLALARREALWNGKSSALSRIENVPTLGGGLAWSRLGGRRWES